MSSAKKKVACSAPLSSRARAQKDGRTPKQHPPCSATTTLPVIKAPLKNKHLQTHIARPCLGLERAYMLNPGVEWPSAKFARQSAIIRTIRKNTHDYEQCEAQVRSIQLGRTVSSACDGTMRQKIATLYYRTVVSDSASQFYASLECLCECSLVQPFH